MELGVGWKTSLDVAKGCWGDVLSSPSHTSPSRRALPSPAASSLTLLAEGPWDEFAFRKLAWRVKMKKNGAQKLPMEFSITGGMAPHCSGQLRNEGRCLKGEWMHYKKLNLLVLQVVVAGPLLMSRLSWSLKPLKAAFQESQPPLWPQRIKRVLKMLRGSAASVWICESFASPTNPFSLDRSLLSGLSGCFVLKLYSDLAVRDPCVGCALVNLEQSVCSALGWWCVPKPFAAALPVGLGWQGLRWGVSPPKLIHPPAQLSEKLVRLTAGCE